MKRRLHRRTALPEVRLCHRDDRRWCECGGRSCASARPEFPVARCPPAFARSSSFVSAHPLSASVLASVVQRRLAPGPLVSLIRERQAADSKNPVRSRNGAVAPTRLRTGDSPANGSGWSELDDLGRAVLSAGFTVTGCCPSASPRPAVGWTTLPRRRPISCRSRCTPTGRGDLLPRSSDCPAP